MVQHAVLAFGLVEARPATAAGELGVGLEEHIATGGAGIGAYAFEIPVLAGEGALGPLVEGHIVEVFGQQLLPLGQRQVQFRGVGVGIVRVVAVVVLAHGVFGR